MEFATRLKNFAKNQDKLTAWAFALATSGTTILVEAAGVSANGGP